MICETIDGELYSIDDEALNEAKWAACNTRCEDGNFSSMEYISLVAENAIKTYIINLTFGVSE
jgi:hypothetical protein